MNRICLGMTVIALQLAASASGANFIDYSGEANVVLGGLPATLPAGLDLDGAGNADLSVKSEGEDALHGATYLTALGNLWFVGSGESIASLSVGDVVSTSDGGPSPLNMLLTGFDFDPDPPNGVGSPLGPYFSETTPQDYYWGFVFSGETLGFMPGWMRVTVNPVTVDPVNQTMSGGELIVREWAFHGVDQTIRVGEIPEPGGALIASTAAVGISTWRRRRSTSCARR